MRSSQTFTQLIDDWILSVYFNQSFACWQYEGKRNRNIVFSLLSFVQLFTLLILES